MTTERSKLISCVHGLWCVAAALVLAAGLTGGLAGGCGSGSREVKLVAPRTIVAPYDRAGGEVLWGVVPLRNESGTSVADSYVVSDKVVAAAAQVEGVRVLPLNRTIATMRALKMMDLGSPADAKRLATEMGVDGLIVGSITAYDPYDPPTIGLSLALYSRTGSMERGGDGVDTRKLTYQPTDYQYFPRSSFESAPASVVSEYLDAKNHQVLMDVKSYAEGRHDPVTALGWKRFTASMDLYTEFAAWRTVGQLIDHEWIRLARIQKPVASR